MLSCWSGRGPQVDTETDITLGVSSERFSLLTICPFEDLRLSFKNVYKLLKKRMEEADSSL